MVTLNNGTCMNDECFFLNFVQVIPMQDIKYGEH